MHAENAFRGTVVHVEPDVLEVHALALDRDNCLRYPRRWYHPRTMKKLRPAGRRSPQQAPPRTCLAADIGGTFTDIVAFDEKTGRLLLGKALSTPPAGRRHLPRHGKSRRALRGRGSLPSRLDHRDQHHASSAPGPRPRYSPPRAFATSTRSGASTGPTRTTSTSGNTCRSSSARSGSKCAERITAEGGFTWRSTRRACTPPATGSKRRASRRWRSCSFTPTSTPRTRRAPGRSFASACPAPSSPLAQLSREYREFERCSTVVANAYIGPVVSEYVRGIDER